jgi:hypothetical protein
VKAVSSDTHAISVGWPILYVLEAMDFVDLLNLNKEILENISPGKQHELRLPAPLLLSGYNLLLPFEFRSK